MLVVDDEEDIALLCRLNLEGEGFAVREAHTGQAAMELLDEQLPDVVLLDVVLPDTSGLDLLHRLRASPRTRTLPIIMLTAQAESSVAEATDYIVKPFDRERLIDAVRRAVSTDLAAPAPFAPDEVVQRLASIVASSDDAIVSASSDGLIVDWNKAAERMYGFTADDAAGRPISLLAPEMDEIVRHVLTGEGIVHREVSQRRKDGTRLDASVSASPIYDQVGAVVGLSMIARDVTQQRRADDRFRGLLESAPDAMVIVDARGVITLVNAQTERLFGYRREELLGAPVELLMPERFAATHPSHRRSYSTSPRVRPMGAGLELYGLRKSGEEFPVEISLSPLQTDEGILVSAAIRDVTERRASERAIAEAYAKERAASQRLRELDQLKSDFLSTVSHELRTPLTVIQGFAQTLLTQWDALGSEDHRMMVGRIEGAGVRLAALIEELLDFTRLERGQVHVDPRPQPIADLVAEAIDGLGNAIDRSRVRVDVAPDVVVVADRHAFCRCMENLLTNACKFSPSDSPVQVSIESSPDEVVVSVADRGPGIPEVDRERVFERFYRVPSTAMTKPGTGIGLAIAKQFVEAQGGRIWVECPEGGGSEFKVALPCG